MESPRIFAIGAVLLLSVAVAERYEPFFEALAAITFVAMMAFGFVLHPRKNLFYVRTSTQTPDLDRNLLIEHDRLAVKIEPTRLWLLFLPTGLAVAFLVISAAQGIIWKFSLLNLAFDHFGFLFVIACRFPLFLMGAALWIWLSERRVFRDAEACSARAVKVREGRVTFQFMHSEGGYGGGDDLYFGLVRPWVLATLVFYNVHSNELAKIGMGLLFHRPVILGRGLTEMDYDTSAAHSFSPEPVSPIA